LPATGGHCTVFPDGAAIFSLSARLRDPNSQIFLTSQVDTLLPSGYQFVFPFSFCPEAMPTRAYFFSLVIAEASLIDLCLFSLSRCVCRDG